MSDYRAKMQFISGSRLFELWPKWGECCICEAPTPLTHSVAYCCEPPHDEIGSESKTYPGHVVGGMPACKPCHDRHYAMSD